MPETLNKEEQDSAAVKRIVVIATLLSSFFTPFVASSTNIALPTIGREFSMSAVSLSWITILYILTSTLFMLPCGKLSDIYGRKRIYTLGMVIFACGGVLATISNTPYFLLSSRAVQGAGAAMIFGNGVAILTTVFPSQKRGKMLGLNTAFVYLGQFGGPVLGGVMVTNLGWRSIFMFSVIAAIAGVILVQTKLKEEWFGAKYKKFDHLGAIIYALFILSFVFGVTQIPQKISILLFTISITMLFIFVKWELRAVEPMFEMKLLKNNRIFLFSNIATFINFGASYAIPFFMSFYFQLIKKMPAQKAGLILISQTIVMAIFSPLTGKMSDKVEPRKLATAGMTLIFLGIIFLSLISEDTPLSHIVPVLMTVGLGFALFASPNTNAIMGSVKETHFSVASATIATMRQSGQIMSMSIAAIVLTMFLGSTKVTNENPAGLLLSIKVSMIIFAVLCFGGIIASFARGNIKSE